MTPRSWSPSLLLACATLYACVDSGCPKGSHEVDGQCMELADEKDAGTKMQGVQGAGTAGHGGSTGRAGSRASSPQDSGTGQSDRGDGGAPGDGGSAASDAAAEDAPDSAASPEEPVTCGNTQCGTNAGCDDSSGTPTCTCADGYQGDGQTCANVDECAAGTHDCDPNATCLDEPGTFSCECKPGYEGDGRTCTPNPCEPRVNPCDPATTTCRADAGQAACDCVEGRGRCDGDELACNTDLNNDRDHCGSCTLECAGALGCEQGECEQAVVALALGRIFSCAVDPLGQVLCWGNNGNSELGRSGTTYEPMPAAIGPVKQMDAGMGRSCAHLQDEDLVCWGSNLAGMLAPGDSHGQGIFPIATDLTAMQEVSVGGSAICARFPNSVECWSVSLGYSLGTTSIADNTVLSFGQRIRLDLDSPIGLSVGNRMACSVYNRGAVTCWGGGRSGPTPVTDSSTNPLANATAVSVSLATDATNTSDSACVLQSTGRVMCWGHNDSGQLGNPSNTATDINYAVTVTDANSTPLEQVAQIGVGAQHACGLRMDGTVVCWGRRDRLGNGSSGTTAQRSFVTVTGVDDAVELAVGTNHSCVRRASGQVQCWGDNTNGQLGANPSTTAFSLIPLNVTGLP